MLARTRCLVGTSGVCLLVLHLQWRPPFRLPHATSHSGTQRALSEGLCKLSQRVATSTRSSTAFTSLRSGRPFGNPPRQSRVGATSTRSSTALTSLRSGRHRALRYSPAIQAPFLSCCIRSARCCTLGTLLASATLCDCSNFTLLLHPIPTSAAFCGRSSCVLLLHSCTYYGTFPVLLPPRLHSSRPAALPPTSCCCARCCIRCVAATSPLACCCISYILL